MNVDLLYKGPNLLGTIELQYYTLSNLFYHYLYEIDTKVNEKDTEILEMENEHPDKKEVVKSDSPNFENIFEQDTLTIKFGRTTKVFFIQILFLYRLL